MTTMNDWLRGTRLGNWVQRCRESRRLVLVIVAIALLLDNMLLTIVGKSEKVSAFFLFLTENRLNFHLTQFHRKTVELHDWRGSLRANYFHKDIAWPQSGHHDRNQNVFCLNKVGLTVIAAILNLTRTSVNASTTHLENFSFLIGKTTELFNWKLEEVWLTRSV